MSVASIARQWGYWGIGAVFLGLAKAQFHLRGYKPKPLSSADIDKCCSYDEIITRYWLDRLSVYAGGVDARTLIKGCDVLELGPGTDLGQGALLLHHGARSYVGFDLHDNGQRGQTEIICAALSTRGYDFERSALRLIIDPTFRLSSHFFPASFDLIVSNSAFEHFDHIEQVIAEMTPLVRPGGHLVLGIAPNTHSRWIAVRDPHNIYRYGDALYRLMYFPGQVNRVRPIEYLNRLRAQGWREPLLFEEQRCESRGLALARKFRPMREIALPALKRTNAGEQGRSRWRIGESCDMDITTFTLIARRAK